MPIDLPKKLTEAEENSAHLWSATMLFAFSGEDATKLMTGELSASFDNLISITVSCMRCAVKFEPALAKTICRAARRPVDNSIYGSRRRVN